MATTTTTTTSSSPFIKQLASSSRQTRDRALSSLKTYIRWTTPFTPTECLKLWKGLFFCMWHSDRPRTQQQLAIDLAELCDVLTKENFINFTRAFWQTMAREWAGIDVLRMNKFLFLIRQYVNAGFRYCARQDWQNEEVTQQYMEILAEVPLNPKDPKIPNGLRHHVMDVYVDELDKVDSERDAPVETLLQPLRVLGKETKTKSVRERVKEALEDERIEDWQSGGVEAGGELLQDGGAEDGLPDADENGSDIERDDDEFGGFED